MKKDKPAFPVSLTDLEHRLSIGEDPQALLKEVVDIIVLNTTVIVPNRRANSMLYSDCIDLLTNHGARLAPTDSDGCALQILSRIPLQNAPSLLNKTVFGLINKPGEFPFHILAKELSMNFWDGVFLYGPACDSTLKAVDSLGRTASHLLWDPENSMSKARQSMLDERDPAMKQNKTFQWHYLTRSAWNLQTRFREWGIGMDKPDNEGRTAMDLCVDRLEAGDADLSIDRSDLDFFSQARARMNNRNMDKQTAQVGAHRPVPRL